MDTYRIIKRLSSSSNTAQKDIAEKMGISPQGLHKALRNNISFNRMNDAIEACGYVLLIGKVEGGKIANVKKAESFSEP